LKNTILNELSYSGKVTVSLQLDGKILKTKEIHNSGTSQLFSFFAYCLAGEFEEAALFRPTKVRLLHAVIDELTGEEIELVPASGMVYLRSKPERILNKDIDGETVKLSFMIPRSMIENIDFNRIALYPQYAESADYGLYSAYCNLVGTDDLGINVYTDWSLSSVLLIDWELTISNKIIKVNNEGGSN
jgi:hypothetical protein